MNDSGDAGAAIALDLRHRADTATITESSETFHQLDERDANLMRLGAEALDELRSALVALREQYGQALQEIATHAKWAKEFTATDEHGKAWLDMIRQRDEARRLAEQYRDWWHARGNMDGGKDAPVARRDQMPWELGAPAAGREEGR